MNSPKFKIGQRVKVVGNSFQHCLKMESVGVVEEIHVDGWEESSESETGFTYAVYGETTDLRREGDERIHLVQYLDESDLEATDD